MDSTKSMTVRYIIILDYACYANLAMFIRCTRVYSNV